jgi:hypothetical protein
MCPMSTFRSFRRLLFLHMTPFPDLHLAASRATPEPKPTLSLSQPGNTIIYTRAGAGAQRTPHAP